MHQMAQYSEPMAFNGFSEAEIETQCQQYRASGDGGLTKSNFVVLKNPDGTDSDTCVKMAGVFEGDVLGDEEAWMRFFRREISSHSVRIPLVYGRFKDDKRNEYLVYEYRSKARTIREIIDDTKRPLSIELAEDILGALAKIRNAARHINLAGGLTPRIPSKGEIPCWTPRGYIFSDCESNRPVSSIQEKLDYFTRIFKHIKEPVPEFEPLCINHGDFSSHNVMKDEDGAIIPLDYGLTSYGPWWEDAFALTTCDKHDYTGPIAQVARSFRLHLDPSLFDKLNTFRVFHNRYGFTYDRHDKEQHKSRNSSKEALELQLADKIA